MSEVVESYLIHLDTIKHITNHKLTEKEIFELLDYVFDEIYKQKDDKEKHKPKEKKEIYKEKLKKYLQKNKRR